MHTNTQENKSVVIKSCIRDLTINNLSFLYLLDVSVKLEYLSFPLHLSDTDLAGELGNHQASSLQTEGAVQRPLTPTPNVVERDFLGNRDRHN